MFRGFLDRSMQILEGEQPVVAAELCEKLRDREAVVEMDGERLAVSFRNGRFRILDDSTTPFIELRSDRRTVLDVVNGRLHLEDTLFSEKLWLRGSLDSIVLFHEALVLYLQGAIGSPSFPWLLDRYREDRVPGPERCARELRRNGGGIKRARWTEANR